MINVNINMNDAMRLWNEILWDSPFISRAPTDVDIFKQIVLTTDIISWNRDIDYNVGRSWD